MFNSNQHQSDASTTYDLTQFTANDVQECALALRNMDSGAKSMEEVANRTVHYLYERLVERQNGNRACALVRFFKTHSYGELTEELQQHASNILVNRCPFPHTKCLTLLATAGEKPTWNSRQGSNGHQAIPLIDENFVEQAPMISQLMRQFNLDLANLIAPQADLLLDTQQRTFNVFYIPDALGSIHIPAQKEFVIPYKIKSILGLGGMFASGNIFAIIMFSKVLIPSQTIGSFKWLSAYAKLASAPFDRGAVFDKEKTTVKAN